MDIQTRQHFLEVMAYTEAASQCEHRKNKHIEEGAEYNLSYAQEVMNVIIPVVESEVKAMYTRRNQHHKKFFWAYVKPQKARYDEDEANKVKGFKKAWEPAERIADIMAVLLTSNLSKGIAYTEVSAEIAKALMKEFGIPFSEHNEWKHKTATFVSPLIDHIAENTPIFTLEQIAGREYRLILTPEWESKVEKIQGDFGMNVSKYKPMILPPKPHFDLISGTGGYYYAESPLIKYPVRIQGKVLDMFKNFNAKNNPGFFKVINDAQNTAYQVNEKLYNVVSGYYADGMTFKKFPIETDMLAAYDSATHALEKRESQREANAKKFNQEYKPLLESTRKKVYKAHEIAAKEAANKTIALLEQCKAYVDDKEIYFPLFLDYRGRRYPYANTSLSFQGDEMAKAMLVFAEKVQINEEGEKALYQSLANAMGVDKVVLEVKEIVARAFFEEHKETFMKGDFSFFFLDSHKDEDAENEEDQPLFDEPLTGLAVCLELLEFEKNPEYSTGYICHRDARCSGASIIGTILRDKDVMEMTSVIDWNGEGALGDAYMRCAIKAEAMCKAKAESGNMLANDLYDLRKKLFIRKIFKDPVMTKSSYGSTDYGVRKRNEDAVKWELLGLTEDHKKLFDDIMLKALDAAMPSCSAYLKASKEAATEAVKSGYVAFTNPISGFPVVQQEFKSKTRDVIVQKGFKEIRLKLTVPNTEKINKVGMKNALAPNKIHSLDAALLNLVQEQCDFPLAMIHDSIGAHCTNVNSVVKAYGNAMRLFSDNNPINEILDQISNVQMEKTNTFKGTLENSRHCLV